MQVKPIRFKLIQVIMKHWTIALFKKTKVQRIYNPSTNYSLWRSIILRKSSSISTVKNLYWNQNCRYKTITNHHNCSKKLEKKIWKHEPSLWNNNFNNKSYGFRKKSTYQNKSSSLNLIKLKNLHQKRR